MKGVTESSDETGAYVAGTKAVSDLILSVPELSGLRLKMTSKA